jgi:hypothetical protein
LGAAGVGLVLALRTPEDRRLAFGASVGGLAAGIGLMAVLFGFVFAAQDPPSTPAAASLASAAWGFAPEVFGWVLAGAGAVGLAGRLWRRADGGKTPNRGAGLVLGSAAAVAALAAEGAGVDLASSLLVAALAGLAASYGDRPLASGGITPAGQAGAAGGTLRLE